MPGTTRGYTMLMIRVEEGDFEGVKAALSKYPNEKINDQNKHGQTALALAARSGNCNIGEFLILEGADINLPNKSGQTPLFIACSYNHIDFVKLLLRHKAEVNIADSRGWTPLMSACQNSNVYLVELLLKCKADVRPIDRFGKNARQRTKDPKITSLLLEIERRIDQLEEDQATSFVTPKKKNVRASSQDSPNKITLKESLIDLDEDDEESILDQYTSSLDQTLRACPQFVQDMEIYKMHKKAGYYKYLKSTDPRNLRAGSLQNLKSDRRDRSLEYLLDLNSTMKSPMTLNDLPTDRSRGNRNTPKDIKDTSKLDDTRNSFSKTVKKDRKPSKDGEEEMSPRSGRTNGTPLMSKTADDQKMDSSLLKSIVSPAGTTKPKYKSILKNSTRMEEFSSPYPINVTQQEDNDEVLNDELKNLYRLFIQKLAERTQKILSDKVAKAIDQAIEQEGPISQERMDEIISVVGAELEEKTIASFKALVAELIDTFPLSDKLGKAIEEGTESLIDRIALYAQEDISRLNHAINSPRKHEDGEGVVQDSMSNSADRLKEAISGKIDELFKALDNALSGKSDEEKEDFVNKYGPEILETLDQLKNRIFNGNTCDEQEEACETVGDLNSDKKSPSTLKKFLEMPSQHQQTSEASANMRIIEAQNSFDMEEMPEAAVPTMARKDSRSNRNNSSPRAGDNSMESELKNNKGLERRDSLNELDLCDLSTQRATEQTTDTLAMISCNNIIKPNMSPKGSDEEVRLKSHRAHSLESDVNSAASPKKLAEDVSGKAELIVLHAHELENDNSNASSPNKEAVNMEVTLKVHPAHSLESDVESHSSSPQKVKIQNAHELESDKDSNSEASSPLKKVVEDNATNTLATGVSSSIAKSSESSHDNTIIKVDTVNLNAHDLESDKSTCSPVVVSSPQKVTETIKVIEVSAPIHNAHELESDKEGNSQTSSPLKKTVDDAVTLAKSSEVSSDNTAIKIDTVEFNAHDLISDNSSEIASPQKTKETIQMAEISVSAHNAHDLESDKDNTSAMASPLETKEQLQIEVNTHKASRLESDVESNNSPSKRIANDNTIVEVCMKNHHAHELESDANTNSSVASSTLKNKEVIAVDTCQQKHNAEELRSDKDSASALASPKKELCEELRQDTPKEEDESQSSDLVLFGKSQKTREFNDQENSRKFTETEENDQDYEGEDVSGRKNFIQRVDTKESEVIYDDQSQRVFEQSGVFIGRRKELLKEDSLADVDLVESEMISNYRDVSDKEGTPITIIPGKRILDKLNTLESEVLYKYDEDTTHKAQDQEIKEEDFDEEIQRSKIVEEQESNEKQVIAPIESVEDSIRTKEAINAETMRKALSRRYVVSQSITSFTSRARPMIPIPTPSKYVTKTVRMQIDEIPYCENFHYLGQSKKARGRSLAVPRKVWKETTVGIEEITIIDN